MKRFYKILTIVLSLVVAIVGAISNLNYQSNDKVKALAYNPQTSNDNYTLMYEGNIFVNYVAVQTTDTTTTLQDFWDHELSGDFINYLNEKGWTLQTIYVDDVVSANNTIASSFSIGSHSIKFYIKAGPAGDYAIGTFSVEEPAQTCSPSLTGTLNQTSYSIDEPNNSSVIPNITDDLIYDLGLNVSNVVYTAANCSTSNVSPTISISPTITFGNNSYTATFSSYGVSFTKIINFNWYYTEPPVCSPSLTGTLNQTSYSIDEPNNSSVIPNITDDLIYDLSNNISNVVYTASNCATTNSPSLSISISPTISFGNNSYTATFSYSGVSFTKNITFNWYYSIPVISGTKSYSTDNKTQISLSTILGNLSVSDDIDIGLIPSVQSDNYTASWETPGTYTIVYQVVDSDNHSSTYTITINVSQWLAPITIATGLPEALIINASLGNGQPLTFVAFMDYLSSHYETPEGVSISITPQTNPVFGANTYLVNGEYSLILSYVDDIVPTLTRPAGTVVSAGTSDTDVLNVIRNSLSVSDNSTNLTTSNITIKTDGYTEHKNAVGSYDVIFAVVDSFNNESTLTITINVVDTTAPNIIGPGTINATINSPLSIEEILSNYTAIDNVEGDVTEDIVVEIDNYTANVSTLGNHSIILRVADSSNNIKRVEIKINVTSPSAATPDTAVTGLLGLIKKVIDWVLNLIKGFFGF